MSEVAHTPAILARNHRLRRGVSLLPGLFTVANLSLGFFACLSALLGTAKARSEERRVGKECRL